MPNTRGSAFFRAFATALALAAAATAPAFAANLKCEPGKVAEKYSSLAGKRLKLAISADIKPLGYRDPANPDKLVGFSPDQAKTVFSCVGVPYDITVASFSGALAALIAGQVDSYWGTLFYTPERAKAVDLVTFMVGASGGVVPKGNPKHLRSLDDVCGLRAVSPVGGLEVLKLNETSKACVAAGKPPLDVMTSPDRPSALQLLDTDRADLYLGIGLKQAYDPSRYTLAFTYVNDLKTGVGIQKGNKDLDQAVYDAFAIMHANGTDKALFTKYEIDPALSLPPEILTR